MDLETLMERATAGLRPEHVAAQLGMSLETYRAALEGGPKRGTDQADEHRAHAALPAESWRGTLAHLFRNQASVLLMLARELERQSTVD